MIPRSKCERKNKEITFGAGTCKTFIRKGLEMNAIIECIITEVWTDRGKFTLVSTYNFCITLEEDYFVEITDKIGVPLMWIEDLNAHNELLGSKKKDRNGIVVEEFIDKYNLVVSSDG